MNRAVPVRAERYNSNMLATIFTCALRDEIPDIADLNHWGEAAVFGALVDVPRRCVTFCLNGVVGPCVRFPAFVNGEIRLVCDYFPDFPPDEWEGGRRVSCATLSTPASMLDVRPKTCAQHRDLGALTISPRTAARLDDFLAVHPPGGGGVWEDPDYSLD